MKINKNSWHYKLMYMLGTLYGRNNICSYMRGVVVSCMLLLFTIFLGVFYVFILLSPIFTNDLSVSSISVITWIFTGLFLIIGLRDYDSNSILFKPICTKKEPGLLAAWLKDKHDKVCTKIEFEEKTNV